MNAHRAFIFAFRCAFVLMTSTAHADIGVAVFAPAAPFGNAAARQQLAAEVASTVATLTGQRSHARIYQRATDFATAVSAGNVQLAIVDPTTATKLGGTIIALGAERPWHLVTKGESMRTLRGASVLVPTQVHEADLLLGLFAGELPPQTLRVQSAPDAESAIASVSLGKARGAAVPAQLALPPGVTASAQLESMPAYVVVAVGSWDSTPVRQQLAQSGGGLFGKLGALGSLQPAPADALTQLQRRFRRVVRRPVWLAGDSSALTQGVIPPRTLAIPQTNVGDLVVAGPLPSHE